jgi:hypothetical protein
MQMRRALRMPSFVAEKSQYRNCQWQERVADARAGVKPKFRHWYHGRVNWLAAAASFLKRIYSNRVVLPLPRQYRGGRDAMTRHRNNVAAAGNSPTMSSW